MRLSKYWPRGADAPRLTVGGTRDIFFDRWSSVNNDPFEFNFDHDIEEHVLSLPLRTSTVIYSIGQKLVTDNDIYPAEPFLNGPTAARSRKIYRGGFDVFRLSISSAVLTERIAFITGRSVATQISLFGPHLKLDQRLRDLLLSVLTAASTSNCLGLETIGLSVTDYLARLYAHLPGRPVGALSNLRLKRVLEFIEENLGSDITLTDLGNVSGLSRMHFAAQFRQATGKSPYAYVLERRIYAARSLLASSTLPIGKIAGAAGFKTCSHFSEAFARSVGQSPSEWRREVLKTTAPSERIRRVIEHIENKIGDSMSLRDLSEVAGLSKMHFAAEFKASTGWSPHSFVIQQRVARAQQLLLETDETTVDIAMLLGFANQSHFTSAFKKIVGQTPGTWQRARKGELLSLDGRPPNAIIARGSSTEHG